MATRQDYSYGIIPVRKNVDNEFEFLLIYQQLGHWSFPKGHLEGAETGVQAAYRELHEETGLTVDKLLFEAAIKEEYSFKWGDDFFEKTVEYWLATVSGEIIIQAAEVQDFKWATYMEAEKLVTYSESRKTLKTAFEIVSIKNIAKK